MTRNQPWRQLPLSTVFDDLIDRIVALEESWTCVRERSGLRHVFGDVRHHVCAAMSWIDPTRATFDAADDTTRLVVHEAFLAVIALGQLVRRAEDDGWAEPSAIDAARVAIDALLDELTPHVSRADTGMRDVLLDDVPLETVLGRLAIA